MAAISFFGVLVLVALSGGLNSADLVEIIEPAAYFKSREVVVSIDRMIDIVVVEPKDAKGQIMQLMALRQLTADFDVFKKASNYATNREAIEEIAAGKRGDDPQGFAKEYAKRMLAKLDGKKLEATKRIVSPADTLDWFPANLTLGAAIDHTRGKVSAPDLFKELLKTMPDNAKAEMYGFIERVGNIRVERIALGYVDAKNDADRKIFVRITGKANPNWVANAIQADGPRGVQVDRKKHADGTPIVVMRTRNDPMVALVGDTDLLVIGYLGVNAKQDGLLDEVLDVRGKKEANAATGKLKDGLAKIPPNAVAFAVGAVPTEIAGELGLKLGGGNLVPAKFLAFIERSKEGIDINLDSPLANADSANQLVRKIGELRKQGVDELTQAMKQPQPQGAPPVPFQDMINILQNVQVQSKAERVQIRLSVPDAFMQKLGTMGGLFFGVAGPLP